MKKSNETIEEVIDKLSNRKKETLITGLRQCQLKNIEHPFITKEEYIDEVLNFINEREDNINRTLKLIEYYQTTEWGLRGYTILEKIKSELIGSEK